MKIGQIDTQVLLLLAPLLVLVVGLELVAIIDLLKADRVVKGGSKVLWLLIILLVNPWGALIYLLFGREDQAHQDAAPVGSSAAAEEEAPVPLVPGPVARSEAIRIEGLGKDFGTFRALDSLD